MKTSYDEITETESLALALRKSIDKDEEEYQTEIELQSKFYKIRTTPSERKGTRGKISLKRVQLAPL